MVDVLPDRLMVVFLATYLFHCALCLFHLHLETCPAPQFAKSIVEAPPKTLILFSLDDRQDLVFSFLILLFLGGLQSAIQVLASVVLVILPEVVALIYICLEAEKDFLEIGTWRP